MRLLTSRSAASACLLVLAACSKSDKSASADTTLNNDLTLAAQSGPVTTTAVGDTALHPVDAPTPAPTKRVTTPTPRPQPRRASTAPAPAPVNAAPAPAAPRNGTIAAGTQMGVVAGSRVCANAARPGDRFVATLSGGITGSNGVAIPAGSKAVIEVASATSAEQGADPSLAFRVRSIETPAGASYSVSGEAIPNGALERVRADGSKGSDTKKVIGGAIAGAILGQMIGHDTKGTVIGAAGGAAAGTIAARATAKYDSCLPSGATLTVTLADPVLVPLQ